MARFGAKLNLNMTRFSRRSQNSFGIWKLIENNRKRRLRLLNFMSYLIMRKKILLQILLSLICMLQCFCLTSPRNRSCRRFLRNPGWWKTVWKTMANQNLRRPFEFHERHFKIFFSLSDEDKQKKQSTKNQYHQKKDLLFVYIV